jgi:hypothetical protein
MLVQRQLMLPVLAAGLLSAALSGCGGAGNQPGGPATSRPATSAKPVIPTTAPQVQGHLFSLLNAARGVHVTGSYTWPHDRVTVDVDLLQSGQIAGDINNGGFPMSVIDVGGKMYIKLTPAFAAYFHHKGCAPLCGDYEVYPRSQAASLVRSMGVKSMFDTLTQMGNSFLSNPIHATFHGQPALQEMTPGYDMGSYVILMATPESLPLEAVDPHHFKLTFSEWNSVPVPAAPPKSKMFVP